MQRKAKELTRGDVFQIRVFGEVLETTSVADGKRIGGDDVRRRESDPREDRTRIRSLAVCHARGEQRQRERNRKSTGRHCTLRVCKMRPVLQTDALVNTAGRGQ